MDAVAAANDTPVQMIDTSIVRVDQHGVCITRNRAEFSRWDCLAMPQPAPKQQAWNESVRAEDTCTRDTARLVRLRAEPTLEAITQ